MNRSSLVQAWGIVILLAAIPHTGAEPKWTIHEWGTLTSLQDESGATLGGINTDDEPVPGFVHSLAGSLLLRPTEVPNNFFQGAPSCHPDVTMRLETPVIYFHPPTTETNLQRADVRVKFRGGWLTEFYPDAIPAGLDFKSGQNPTGPARRFHFGPLRSDSESELTWSRLKIGGDWPLTDTTAHVWTSPRAVAAASVQTTNGESEKFLFYRGVAHLNAPLSISRDPDTDQLVFRGQLELPVDKPLDISALWLVDIRADGEVAFRPLPALTLQPGSKKILTRTAAVFSPPDFSRGNFKKMKAVLQEVLIREGLFADETLALLNTWELSYFKSPGLRVFFIVPRAWIDFYLPLDISLPADLNRVMVGRIELVTPDQRKKLQEISRFTPRQIESEVGQLFTNFYGKITFNTVFGGTNRPSQPEMQQVNKDLAQVNSGQKSLGAFILVPPTYQTYLELGRFRNALILDAASRNLSTGLSNFISIYGLEAGAATQP